MRVLDGAWHQSQFWRQQTQRNCNGRAKSGMKIAAQEESALIQRIVAGETQLFHELIRPYEKLVYVTILTMVKNEAEAEDGAQETVINAFRHLKSFRGEAKFSTWLVTIAMNEGRKRLRKVKVAAETPLEIPTDENEGDFTPAVLTDWREIPLEALERKELRTKLREAVKLLPEKYREVFVLRDIEGLNQEETAAALGINVTLVKVRLHRARMMLQKGLVPYLKSEAPGRDGFFRRWFQ
jgi:RNA polymerase sigma-70 factor (ECF subfamily)